MHAERLVVRILPFSRSVSETLGVQSVYLKQVGPPFVSNRAMYQEPPPTGRSYPVHGSGTLSAVVVPVPQCSPTLFRRSEGEYLNGYLPTYRDAHVP